MAEHLARIFSAELEGVDARLVEVEVDLNVGLHSWNIVGLGDKAVSEARERVNSALKNAGVKPPNRENRKITVNLAPADMRKGGSHYDLPIALGYLLASDQIKKFDSSKVLFLGELSLDGRLRHIPGALAIAETAQKKGFEYVFLPEGNANEASAIEGIKIIAVKDLREAIALLEGQQPLSPHIFKKDTSLREGGSDISEIRGQENAKRAMLITASGGHNLLMIGPPGVGKSFLASSLPQILPELTREESISITKIWSAAGMKLGGLIEERPFRAPHQTSSLAAVIGGGTDPKPGEISLAHGGVLFLDELPEFPRNILESLRAPLESGSVRVSRAKNTLEFPAKFSLIAAMNPCPCGFFGDPEKECRCGAYEIIRYQKKISGPLLDRIDLQVRVPRVPLEKLRNRASAKENRVLKDKIKRAREIQAERFIKAGLRIRTNSEMSAEEIEDLSFLTDESELFLSRLKNLNLSPRGFYRILKTARTIADLEENKNVLPPHLAEALSFRLKEQEL